MRYYVDEYGSEYFFNYNYFKYVAHDKKQQGITIEKQKEELADTIGVTPSEVNMYLHGKRTPDDDGLNKITDYYSIDSKKQLLLEVDEHIPKRKINIKLYCSYVSFVVLILIMIMGIAFEMYFGGIMAACGLIYILYTFVKRNHQVSHGVRHPYHNEMILFGMGSIFISLAFFALSQGAEIRGLGDIVPLIELGFIMGCGMYDLYDVWSYETEGR